MLKINKTQVDKTELYFLTMYDMVVQIEPKKSISEFTKQTFPNDLMFIPQIGNYVTPDKIEILQHYNELLSKQGTLPEEVDVHQLTSEVHS